MKRSITGLLAFCVAILVSCKKDGFLDRTPLSQISEAEYWKTTSDLQLYCNNFYNTIFPSYTGFGSTGIYGQDADQGSDNMIAMGYDTFLNGEATIPATGGGWDWTTLRNINYFMANYNKVAASWDNVKPFVGEALFFRAWYYYGMLKNFGNLPWIGKPLSVASGELYGPRLARNIIADSILQDLDRAIDYLPTKSKQQAMRITKEAAMAFCSRVALYEGTWEKYHANDAFGVQGQDGTKYLQKAATVAETLINSNVHNLDNVGVANGYWRLFNQTDYSGSNEIMLWRRYDVAAGVAHNWHRYTYLGAGRGVTKGLVDAYLCTDGKPISGNALYQGDDSLTRVVANRDPRLSQTIYLPGYVATTNQPNGAPDVLFKAPAFDAANENKCATGYQLYKGNNPDYYQQYASSVGTTGLIFIRYAEVLLNFAEAKAELGTLSQADADKSINKLRLRVGMPVLNISAITPDPQWQFSNLSPLINEVRRERRVELACEGFRRDDIFRWAAADKLILGWKPKGAKKAQWTTLFAASVLNSYPVDANGYIELFQNIPAMSAGYQFKTGRNYLSPIPTNELTLNGQLKQNPGW